MSHHVTGRIESAVFAIHLDTGQLQRRDTCRGIRRYLMLQIDEIFLARQFLLDLTRIHFQQIGQRLQLILIQFGIGCRPHGTHRCRLRQHVAVTIQNLTARGRDIQHATIARITAFLQKIFIDDLQVKGTANQRQQGPEYQRRHQMNTPAGQLILQHRALGKAMILAAHCAPPSFCTFFISGGCMPSFSRAIFSIRVCAAHEDISSCS